MVPGAAPMAAVSMRPAGLNTCNTHQGHDEAMREMRGAHLVQVLDQKDEVLPVLGLAAPLARVLPVQVQAVKLVAADEGQGGAGEGAPGGRVGSHLGIFLTALIPAPDSQCHLEKKTDCQAKNLYN